MLLAFKRILHHWQTFLTLLFGVILATGLLASGPLLVNTLMDFALPYKMRNVSPLDSNLRLTVFDLADATAFENLDNFIREEVNRTIGDFADEIVSSVGSPWVYPWFREELLPDQRVNFRSHENIQENLDFITGSWPESEGFNEQEIQVVISEVFAEAYDLEVGDQLPISQDAQANQPMAHLQIAGIARPKSSHDIYWFGEYNPLLDQGDQRWTAQFSAIVPLSTIFEIRETFFPISRLEMNWNILIDSAAIKFENVPLLIEQIREIKIKLEDHQPRISLATHLNEVLEAFVSQSHIVRATLFIILGELLILTLYYTVMISTLAAQQMAGEFSTFSSRGGSFSQIFRIQGLEAGLIGLIAMLSSPFIAMMIVWGLTQIGPLAGIQYTDWNVQISSSSWIAAGVGAIFSILSLLFPILSAVKHGVVAQTRKSSRANHTPWWQRFYLDVFILVIGLALLWRLNLYGGLITGDQERIDWLLLLSPMLLLIGSATILLRVFPWFLKITEHIVAQSRGLPSMLAIWQTSRNPTHVSRLVLLLTLTMALGILSAGINISLEYSEYERARYIAGSDLRLAFSHFTPETKARTQSSKFIAKSDTTTTWRGIGSASIRAYRTYPAFDVLAVDPFEFVKVAELRFDFSEQPMGQLLGYLATGPEQIPDKVTQLPGKPSHLGAWILENPAFGGPWEKNAIDFLNLRAKLHTAEGEFFLVDLELQKPTNKNLPDTEPKWQYFEAVLSELPDDAFPLSLHSYWFSMRPMRDETRYRVSLTLDDFSVTDRQTAERITFEDFETIEHIWTLNNAEYLIRYSKRQEARSGQGSLSLEIPGRPNPQGLALFLAGKLGSTPLPALVSEEFMRLTQLEVGDVIVGNINSIQTLIEIKGVVRYFPTLYDEPGRGFIVTARTPLIYLMNRELRTPVNIDELWIEIGNQTISSEPSEAFPDAIQIRQAEEERRVIKAEPLLMGLRSVTYLGYLMTLILSLVGLATYFYLNARQREIAYGVLRSLGLSPSQLYGSLFLEQAITIITGLTLGTILGLLLNNLVLPGLPISSGGNPPIPPFLVYQDWTSILFLYLFLLGSYLVVLMGVTALLWRSRIHRVMRIGQE